MKKIFTLAAIAAVAFSFTLTSCSKSAKDYYEEEQALTKELEEAQKAGDEAKVKELNEKIEALSKEVEEKIKNDPEFAKECLELAASELAK